MRQPRVSQPYFMKRNSGGKLFPAKRMNRTLEDVQKKVHGCLLCRLCVIKSAGLLVGGLGVVSMQIFVGG